MDETRAVAERPAEGEKEAPVDEGAGEQDGPVKEEEKTEKEEEEGESEKQAEEKEKEEKEEEKEEKEEEKEEKEQQQQQQQQQRSDATSTPETGATAGQEQMEKKEVQSAAGNGTDQEMGSEHASAAGTEDKPAETSTAAAAVAATTHDSNEEKPSSVENASIIGQAEARRAQALQRLQQRKKRMSESGGEELGESAFQHNQPPTGQHHQQQQQEQSEEQRASRTDSTRSASSQSRSRNGSTLSSDKGPRGFMKWLSGSASDPQRAAQQQQQRAAQQRRQQLQREATEEEHRRQRANLLNMNKLAVKTLIESSVGLAGALTEQHRPLNQLLLLLERTLSHGIKNERQGMWRFFDAGQPHVPAACADVVQRARSITAYRTPVGRARFCLRTMMMEQVLSDFIRVFCDNEPLLNQVYHPWAFMAGDGATVLSGLLMGLGVLQIQLSTQADVLDTQTSELDLSLYLREGNYLRPAVEEDPTEEQKRFSEDSFNALTDQNATLREVNKKYQRQIEELSARVDALKEEVASTQTSKAALESTKTALESEVLEARKEAEAARQQCARKLAANEQDIAAERATYDESRSKLKTMMDALQKQLDTERELREEIEGDRAFSKGQQKQAEEKAAELTRQMEAQEEIITNLRKQLKEVKSLNLKMLTNLQELQEKLKEEQTKCHEQQQDIDSKTAEIQSLHGKVREAVSRREHIEAALTEVSTRLKAADGKRVEMETTLTVEQQWRQGLQEELDRAKQKLEEMEMVKTQHTAAQEELQALKTKHTMLQESYKEQERALLEMGERLSETALRVDKFEAQEKRNRQKQWADDSEIKECQGCNRAFGVKRRKHHCRACGGIFCAECSDHRRQLPSYAKPVRVCDTCEKDIAAKMAAA